MRIDIHRMGGGVATVNLGEGATVREALSERGTGQVLSSDDDRSLLDVLDGRGQSLSDLGDLRINGASGSLDTEMYSDPSHIVIVPKVKVG